MENRIHEDKYPNTEKKAIPWYFRGWTIFVAILCVGPLGLILLWFRPNTKLYIKVLISAVVIVLTIWMMAATVNFYTQMLDYYQQLAGTTSR